MVRSFGKLGLCNSRAPAPSSLVAGHLDIASIDIVLVLDGSHAVNSWTVLELDALVSARVGLGTFLQDTFR